MGNLLASLYTGNTGLHAASVGVGTVGDNIANSNTVGFKAARAHFQDLMSQFLVGAGGGNQLGKGVALERIEKLFTQGALQQTGVPTDMAIAGDGFFVLRGVGNGGATQNFYSRAGNFRFDDQGFLVNPSNLRVQGYSADPAGVLGAGLGDLQVSRRTLDPQATGRVEIHANLKPDDPIFPAFDPLNPDGTSSYRTSMVVYDSLGNSHQVDVFGTQTAAGTWEMNAMVDGGEIGGVPGQPTQVPLGNLVFDANGRLDQQNIPNPINFAWTGAAAAGVTFDFGDPIAAGGTGRAGSTQWNTVGQSATSFITQDGYGTGTLEALTVNQQGLITGGFSNGRTLVLGQVAMARFQDPTGLSAVGGNQFVETADSGVANIGSALTGGRGSIYGGTLEQSNVEISDQFIDLIAYQRAFQANSRTISTADGLLQEVFQILR